MTVTIPKSVVKKSIDKNLKISIILKDYTITYDFSNLSNSRSIKPYETIKSARKSLKELPPKSIIYVSFDDNVNMYYNIK